MIKRFTLAIVIAFLHFGAFSQVSITSLSTPYTQDFNTLANSGTANTTLPTGWLFLETGTSGNTTYAADDGSTNSGNTYSYGTTSATERSFGTLQSGNTIPTIGVSFTNNSGSAITAITVSYTGKQWRVGLASRTAADSLNFQYSTTATSLSTGTWTDVQALSFASPALNTIAGAVDGNAAANKTAKSFTITGLNIANGATFFFRWNDYNITGADDGLAIDDVNLAFNGAAAQTCAEPAAQPTNLALTPTPTTVAGTFTASAADQFMVVRSTSATAPVPVDGTDYTVGTSPFGANTFIVSNGTSASFTATGLTPSQLYYFYVFALNDDGCTGGPNYLNVSPLSGSTTTLAIPACTAPAAAPTNLVMTATNTAISGSFTAASGTNRYLVAISTTATLSASPVNGTAYTAGSNFGGGKIVSYGTTTAFSATGLTANTAYYVFVFSANGDCTGEPFYNTTALTGTKTTTNNSTGIPAGYYDAATGLTCQPLKTALKNIISNGFQVLGYTPGIWNIYKYSDMHRNDANTADIIWDMYSDNPTGAEPYTYTYGTNQCGNYNSEGDCYNREHSTPQSWFNSQSPMVSDAHHLFPVDGKVNGERNNYPYGSVSSASITTANGSKLGTGSNFGYTGIVFEPIDAYKGDFARACLYMATRYEDEIISQNWSANGNGNDVLLSTSDQSDAALRRLMIYDPWYIQTLVKWSNQDPPSQKEIDRNNAIYSQAVAVDGSGTLKAQSNRNPFVDHPEYVTMIWGTGTVASLSCSTTTPACVAPTAQPTALVLTPTASSIAGSFTAASPAPSSYLVVRSTVSTLSATPANATTYTAGQALGGGTVVQYSSATSFTDAGLTAGTTYYYYIFSANNTTCTGGPVYLTTSPLTGNKATTAANAPCVAPTAQPTALSLIPATNSISGSFTVAPGAPSAYLVIRSTSATLTATPANTTTYTAGQALGGGTVVQYSSTTSFTDAGLTAGTTYYYYIFSSNNAACTGGPLYLTATPLAGSTTTTTVAGGCTTPTVLATNLVFTRGANSITGTFTGNGTSSYLVLMTTTPGLSNLPVNGITYTAGQTFGNARVISFGNTTTFTVNNLVADKNYYFFVFTANTGCVGSPFYNTSSLKGTGKIITRNNLYPNPARNSITLELYDVPATNLVLSVIDMLGREVKEQVITTGQQVIPIDISKLSLGKYYVTVKNNNIKIVKPFIKK